MPAKLDLEEIRGFWTQQARAHGQAPSASWSDRMLIDMEVREILKHLADGDCVLDVGCANGFSTLQFAAHLNVRVRGIDYIPEMIEQARRRLLEFPGRLEGNGRIRRGRRPGANGAAAVLRQSRGSPGDHQSGGLAPASQSPATVRKSAQIRRRARFPRRPSRAGSVLIAFGGSGG